MKHENKPFKCDKRYQWRKHPEISYIKYNITETNEYIIIADYQYCKNIFKFDSEEETDKMMRTFLAD